MAHRATDPGRMETAAQRLPQLRRRQRRPLGRRRIAGNERRTRLARPHARPQTAAAPPPRSACWCCDAGEERHPEDGKQGRQGTGQESHQGVRQTRVRRYSEVLAGCGDVVWQRGQESGAQTRHQQGRKNRRQDGEQDCGGQRCSEEIGEQNRSAYATPLRTRAACTRCKSRSMPARGGLSVNACSRAGAFLRKSSAVLRGGCRFPIHIRLDVGFEQVHQVGTCIARGLDDLGFVVVDQVLAA